MIILIIDYGIVLYCFLLHLSLTYSSNCIVSCCVYYPRIDYRFLSYCLYCVTYPRIDYRILSRVVVSHFLSYLYRTVVFPVVFLILHAWSEVKTSFGLGLISLDLVFFFAILTLDSSLGSRSKPRSDFA